MKTTIGRIRMLIQHVLSEGWISDYAKQLSTNAQKEDQLEAQFPGALHALVADADDLELEFLTDLGYGRQNISSAVELDILLSTVDFQITQDGKLICNYFDPPKEWDPDMNHHVRASLGFHSSRPGDKGGWKDYVRQEPDQRSCDNCNGTGKVPGFTGMWDCEECGGTGRVK